MCAILKIASKVCSVSLKTSCMHKEALCYILYVLVEKRLQPAPGIRMSGYDSALNPISRTLLCFVERIAEYITFRINEYTYIIHIFRSVSGGLWTRAKALLETAKCCLFHRVLLRGHGLCI